MDDPASETVRFETLPAVDREKFRRHGWADGDFLGFGSSLLYLRGEILDSALVPEPDPPVIVWDAPVCPRNGDCVTPRIGTATFTTVAPLL